MLREHVNAKWATKITLKVLLTLKQSGPSRGDRLQQADVKAKLTQVAEAYGFDF